MEKLKEFLLKPVYKSIKVWHIALFVIIVGVVAPSQDEEKENDGKKSEKKVEKVERISMTKSQANDFMLKHCDGAGQRLLDTKEVNVGEGMYVFAFLTEASQPGYYCVTTVNKTIYGDSQDDFRNAILNADCGRNEKLTQWSGF